MKHGPSLSEFEQQMFYYEQLEDRFLSESERRDVGPVAIYTGNCLSCVASRHLPASLPETCYLYLFSRYFFTVALWFVSSPVNLTMSTVITFKLVSIFFFLAGPSRVPSQVLSQLAELMV